MQVREVRWQSRPEGADALRALIREQIGWPPPALAAQLASAPEPLRGQLAANMAKEEAKANEAIERSVRSALAEPVTTASVAQHGRVVTTGERGFERHQGYPTELRATEAFNAEVKRIDKRRWLVRESSERTLTVEPLSGEVGAEPLTVPQGEPEARALVDTLLERGDLRGVLASRMLAGQSPLELLGAHGQTLLGPFASKWLSHLFVTWRHGFVVGAQLTGRPNDDVGTLAGQLLSLPLFTSSLETFHLGMPRRDGGGEWAAALRGLAQSPVASRLRELKFDHEPYLEYQISWLQVGDFTVDWSRFAALEALTVEGANATWSELRLPSLKRFVRESGGLGDAELEAFARAQWPRLEHFEVWSGASSRHGASATAQTLTRVLEAAANWPLKRLGLVNSELVGALLPTLRALPWVNTLERLDVSKGTLTDTDLPGLLALAAHLQGQLDVSENLISDESLTALRGALGQRLISTEQRTSDEEGARFVAVGE